MKEKGFTLVELLVVMVILGIITAISFPLVRNIRENSTEREYQTYQDSVKYAAKLYVNAYENDLFGHEDSGCIILTYDTLKARNLLKDIELRGVSCASEDTYVRVVKMNGKYGYSVHLGCGKKNDSGEVVVNYHYPKEEFVSNDTCGMDAATIMNIGVKVKEPESIQYKKRTMNVLISSSTGVNSDPIIQYGFSVHSTPELIDNWQRLVIDPESVSNQMTKIEKGETIQVTSSQIETPDLLTGQYYLILRVDRLQDVSGKNWSNDETDGYISFGPFTLDNTPPSFQDSTITSSDSNYNNLNPKLQLNVMDDITPLDQLKMCISYDKDSCLKTKKNLSDYEKYDSRKILEKKIHNALDGSSHKVFVTVVDAAGNFATKEFLYDLAFTITYDGNGNTGGSTANTYCNKNVDCPLRENGFEKSGYTYVGWFDQVNGGNSYGTITRLTSNIMIYAHWNVETYTITYHLDDGVATNNAFYTVDTPTFTLNNPTKAGYTFSGWTGSNGTKKQKTVKIEKGSKGNKNYTAHYDINAYTITYNGNGNTGGSTTSNTCNYLEDCSFQANGFSKTGYIFDGWYTAASGGSKYGASIQLSSNITVYAHWIAATPYIINFNYNKAGWNRNNTKTCTPNANGKCSVTTPEISQLSGTNKSGQNYSNYLNILGWSMDSSATTATYGASASIEVSGNTTFYAIVTLAKTSFWSNADALMSRVRPGTKNTSYGQLIGKDGLHGNNSGHYVTVDDFAYKDDHNHPLWLHVTSYDSFYSCQNGPRVDCPATGCSCTNWSSAYYLIYP